MIVFEHKMMGSQAPSNTTHTQNIVDVANAKVDAPINALHLENDIVIAAPALNNPEPIALRCSTPLDANELERHGYPLSYCDMDCVGPEQVLCTLDALKVKSIVFFYDVYGPDFDAHELCEKAACHNINVLGVLLPFPASEFACWDNAQWRIFANRLSRAVSSRVLSYSSHILIGGRHYANTLQ